MSHVVIAFVHNHPSIEIRFANEQVLHGEQRGGLGHIKPQPGKLDPPCLTALPAETVTVRLAVVDDRRLHAAAQILQIALQRRTRNFKFAYWA